MKLPSGLKIADPRKVILAFVEHWYPVYAGYRYPHLDDHVSCGNFVRVGHGLYRLPRLAPSEHDDLIRLTLWSRNRFCPPAQQCASCVETRT